MRALKSQSKILLNMNIVVNYLNFVFNIEVKAKSKYKILNFGFQFIKKTKWYFVYTGCRGTGEQKTFRKYNTLSVKKKSV